MSAEVRTCRWCNVGKPVASFRAANGRQCSACAGALTLARRERYKIKLRTDARSASLRAATVRRWKERNMEKVRAQHSAHKALRSGKLVRPSVCEQCNAPCKPQMHHVDYRRRLDVRWLCGACHRTAHGIVHRIISDAVPVPPVSVTAKTSVRCPTCGLRSARHFSAARGGFGGCPKCGCPFRPGAHATVRRTRSVLVASDESREPRIKRNGTTVHPLKVREVRLSNTGELYGWFSLGHHDEAAFRREVAGGARGTAVEYAYWRKIRRGGLLWLYPVARARAAAPVTLLRARPDGAGDLVCPVCTEARAKMIGDEA